MTVERGNLPNSERCGFGPFLGAFSKAAESAFPIFKNPNISSRIDPPDPIDPIDPIDPETTIESKNFIGSERPVPRASGAEAKASARHQSLWIRAGELG